MEIKFLTWGELQEANRRAIQAECNSIDPEYLKTLPGHFRYGTGAFDARSSRTVEGSSLLHRLLPLLGGFPSLFCLLPLARNICTVSFLVSFPLFVADGP